MTNLNIEEMSISYPLLTQLKNIIPNIKRVKVLEHCCIDELSDIYVDCDLSDSELNTLSLYLLDEVIEDDFVCKLRPYAECTSDFATDITHFINTLPFNLSNKERLITDINITTDLTIKLNLMAILLNNFPPEKQFNTELLSDIKYFSDVFHKSGRLSAYTYFKNIYNKFDELKDLFKYYGCEVY